MGRNRWEWLEGVRPQTPAEALSGQYAKMLADELFDWPPDVAWSQDEQRRSFAVLFEEHAPRPSLSALEAGFSRLELELAHDLEALAHDARNHGLEQACPDPRERLAAQFVRIYVGESFSELFERTENRFKRRHAIAALKLLTLHLRRRWDG